MVRVALRRITAQYQIYISDENTCIHSNADRVTNITHLCHVTMEDSIHFMWLLRYTDGDGPTPHHTSLHITYWGGRGGVALHFWLYVCIMSLCKQ